MWHNRFKIALVKKDTDTLQKLLNEMPEFTDVQEMKKASFLVKGALELLHTLKDETSTSMKQIRQNIDFLNVTINNSANKLDIKS